MCGIAGYARFRSEPARADTIGAMVRSLHHRGPDDHGIAQFPESGAAMGMTRLSILDIAGGHQPMWDESRRYVLVFNGEIYNFRDLWTQLEKLGHRFASDHSDTEVIVHGFEEWGSGVFARLNGMFAVAVWDTRDQLLTLARDRMGEKPLYVGKLPQGGWAFGSELKALLVHPEIERRVDVEALEQFLAFDFILGPRSIIQGITKVPAGHVVVAGLGRFDMDRYWRPSFVTTPRRQSEATDHLDNLLQRSVELRLAADVPVGLFLSGGLDSTTIGWYMARATSKVRAFSIGFEDPRFDESTEARLAAHHLGVSHDLHVFTDAQVLDLVPRVTELLDEPMGDQSVFPTYLLSAVARRHVKVAIGGDGSDELFMGYRTYQALKVAWLLDRGRLAGVAAWPAALPRHHGPRLVRKAGSFARTLKLSPEQRLMTRLGSFGGDSRWVLAPGIVGGLGEVPGDTARKLFSDFAGAELAAPERTIAAYLRGYLQEDILVKVDRASMANSLEVRSPFLDPALVDFALSLPASMKLHGMRRKDPLRRLMRGRIPERIIERPKRGFGAPLPAWLRGPLAPLVDGFLTQERLADAGLFDAKAVAGIMERHRAGDDGAGNQVWLLLQFEMWRDRWINRARSSLIA